MLRKGNRVMGTRLKDVLKRVDDLIRNNKKARIAAYAVILIALCTAAFGLGERLGAFAFLITH